MSEHKFDLEHSNEVVERMNREIKEEKTKIMKSLKNGFIK